MKVTHILAVNDGTVGICEDEVESLDVETIKAMWPAHNWCVMDEVTTFTVNNKKAVKVQLAMERPEFTYTTHIFIEA